jgi:hypothetical protein
MPRKTAATAVPTDLIEYQKAVAKVKARVARWPSAYASGQVVTEYKRAMTAKGKPAYKDDVPRKRTRLARWYAEEWIDIATGKPCGSVHTEEYYPTCRPAKRITKQSPVVVTELSASARQRMVAQKQVAKEKTVKYADTQAVRTRKIA